MRVTVFGATGGIGRLVVQQLLDQGHHVTALTRTPGKLNLTHPHLDLITGQLSDRTAVQQAVVGADAVISALGPSLKRSTTGTQLSDGTRAIVEAMDQAKVTRFIGLATPPSPTRGTNRTGSTRCCPSWPGSPSPTPWPS